MDRDRHGRGNALAYGARSLDVVDYAGARVSELRALRVAAAAISGNRRVYQQLSWHQRRRTMSHTSHRMPARLRVAHRRELAQQAAKPKPGPDGAPPGEFAEPAPGPAGKMRCRKYRRRAGFLLAHRALRAKSPRWLETHIWHAKRFLMDSIAGGRTVAIHPNDRGLRSGYRAISHASLVHDASYLDVIELTCNMGKAPISTVLSACLQPEDAMRAAIDPVVNGIRRVECLIITDPSGKAIGPVDALWRPSKAGHLWLWCHPAASVGVVAALEAAAAATEVQDKGNAVDVTLTSGDILTFSVIGPRAGAVVGAVMHCVRDVRFSSPDEDIERDTKDGIGKGVAEWECVRGVRSAASMPAGCVIALDVEDPRASFPPKRTGEGGQLQMNRAVAATLTDGFCSVGDSGLWSRAARVEASSQAQHTDGTEFIYVPVLLIQRRAGLARGFGSGWDIALPRGWGMTFWTSLMYANGGRAAGQRELQHIALECGRAVFPDDYQDCAAGLAGVASAVTARMDTHARRPKSKRVDYSKYKIQAPFSADLAGLVRGAKVRIAAAASVAAGTTDKANDASTANIAAVAVKKTRRPAKRQRHEDAEPSAAPAAPGTRAEDDPQPDVRVLRSASAIRNVLGCANRAEQAPPAAPLPGTRRYERGPARRQWVRVKSAPVITQATAPRVHSTSLLRVTIRPLCRGVPQPNAEICVPAAEDLAALTKSQQSASGPRELLARRSELREATLAGRTAPGPSRKVIGRVVHGNYAMVAGEGRGSGVIVAGEVRGLSELGGVGMRGRGVGMRGRGVGEKGLDEERTVVVLFRNVTSLQYRFAAATVRIGWE
jgi:POPLD (NUC188) domain/Ribonucleases P/MRP protein subunit POP1